MRLPESQIKAAILHPEEEVRLTALAYFADSYTTDESLMPLVIEAAEKYGSKSAFRILRDAERLPQAENSFNWLLNELKTDFDPSDIAHLPTLRSKKLRPRLVREPQRTDSMCRLRQRIRLG